MANRNPLLSLPLFGFFGEKTYGRTLVEVPASVSDDLLACVDGSDMKACVGALITHIKDRDFGLDFLIVGFKWRVDWITGRMQAHLS